MNTPDLNPGDFMLVLTIVAVRLIGIWLIATHAGSLVAAALAALNMSRPSELDDVGDATFMAILVSAALPLIAGLILILLSGSLSRLIVPRIAHDLPTPTAVSAKTVTQIGVFLIGLWLVGSSLPVVVALAPSFGLGASFQSLAALVLGVVLMLGSGLLAGMVGKLRNWP